MRNNLVALLVVGIAALVEGSGLLGQGASTLLFVAAIAIAAWVGGLVPGALATGLTVLARAYLHSVPTYLEPAPTRWRIHLVMLVLVGVLLSVLFEALHRAHQRLIKARRIDLMYEAGRRFSGTLVVEEIYEALREMIGGAMRYDGMIVSSYDPASRVARCAYGWASGKRFDPATLPPLTIRLDGPGMQTEVIRTGEARLYGDVRERVRRPGARYFDVDGDGRVRDLRQPGAAPPGASCALMVPIKLEGKVIGIVQVMCDRAGAYKREHLTTLESLVAPMAVALQNAELYARAGREIAERELVEDALKESEERLRKADKRKDEFLATLAHELRNPLAPIRMAVEVLREQFAETTSWNGVSANGAPPGSNIEWANDVIARQVKHMACLLDDLLDVSRISRGALQLRKERTELAEAVRNAVEASHPLIVAGGHNLTTSLPAERIFLDADATRLGQVFSNLLNNAARYSEAGSKIRLSVELAPGAPGGPGAGPAAEEAVIRVRDEGIGISAEMLPRIFEPFLQIDRSLERSRGGLGIGLALVKQIVELHGGRVEASSEGVGKGSDFVVRLPVMPVPAASTAASAVKPAAVMAAAAPAGATAGKHPRNRVLVADDVKDSADALASLLESKGHEVRIAYDGEAAVEAAREFRPDVIVLDIGMPTLNGYEAARRIRKGGNGGKPPVLIALTGWGHEADRVLTKEAGFDHHLVKPIEPAAITRLVSIA